MSADGGFTAGFPQARLAHVTGGLPVEVTLIARFARGAGDALIHDAAHRQREHPGFVDALDEPSVRLAPCMVARVTAARCFRSWSEIVDTPFIAMPDIACSRRLPAAVVRGCCSQRRMTNRVSLMLCVKSSCRQMHCLPCDLVEALGIDFCLASLAAHTPPYLRCLVTPMKRAGCCHQRNIRP